MDHVEILKLINLSIIIPKKYYNNYNNNKMTISICSLKRRLN